MRHAARRDDVEPALIRLARSLGAQLVMAPPLDWWLYHRGQWVAVEIKDPMRAGRKDEYTSAQRRFLDFARANNARWLVWRTEADVLRDLGGKISA